MTSLEWSQVSIRVTSYFPCVSGTILLLGILTETAWRKYPAGPSLTGATVM